MVKAPLVPDSWRNQVNTAEGETSGAFDVTRELREGAGSNFKDEPVALSLVARLLGVMQSMFGGPSSSNA